MTNLLSKFAKRMCHSAFARSKPGSCAFNVITLSRVKHAERSGGEPRLRDFPPKTFKEFVAWVKANPGKFSYGQVNASSGHQILVGGMAASAVAMLLRYFCLIKPGILVLSLHWLYSEPLRSVGTVFFLPRWRVWL